MFMVTYLKPVRVATSIPADWPCQLRFYQSLQNSCIFCKQCRARSDTDFCSIWLGATPVAKAPFMAYEPPHDKTNKMAVWSESSLCAQWVAEDPSFLHADSKDSDQTGQMPRLIWVFAGCTSHFVGFVMRRLICAKGIFLMCDANDVEILMALLNFRLILQMKDW